MGLSIRTLLIWLLVLAVPAQGAAAATLAFCGPNHLGGGATAHAHPGVAAAHTHPGIETLTAHDHPSLAALAGEGVGAAALAAPTSAVTSSAASAPISALPAKAAPADNHKCSACAACCSVAAILSTVPSVPTPGNTTTVFSAVVTTVDVFAADGPDRPPRIAFA